MPPKEEKKKKLSKAEKRARLLEKQEEERRKKEELDTLRSCVSDLLAYQTPPSAIQFLSKEMPSLQKNPWRVLFDVHFGRKFTSSLIKVFSQNPEELSAEEKKQVAVITDGIKDLSSFAFGQPVYFITDEEIHKNFVQLLDLVLYSEDLFSWIVNLMIPTINNPSLTKHVAAYGLVDIVLEFIYVHMFATESSADVDPNAAEDKSDDKTEQPQLESKGDDATSSTDATAAASSDIGQAHPTDNPFLQRKTHSYSDETFFAVFNTVKALSGTPELRDLVKSSAKRYIHVRGLASGAIHGLTQERRMYANACLKQFIQDNAAERAISGLGEEVNTAMVQYWQGHIHELFCKDIATDVSTANNALGARRGKPFKPGFQDASAVETLYHQVKKRSLQVERARTTRK